MSSASANQAKRVRHNNRKRGVFKLTRQRYMLPIALLASLCALFVHFTVLQAAPTLYKLWERYFGPPETPDHVATEDEQTRIVVRRPMNEELREAEEQPPPPEPQEPEEIEHTPEEIDVLDMDLKELVMAPGDTNLPLPEPEVEQPDSTPEMADIPLPEALSPALLGTSDMPDQDEFIPEPTPLNSNSVIANATPQSEALKDADGFIEAEMRRQAREGQDGLGSEVRSLAELMKVRNPGSNTGVARLKSDVLFAFDQCQLKNEARIPLIQLAALIIKNPQTRFIIEGHTDSFGSEEYNALLALQRAAAVCRWLAANKVPVNNVYMRACGCSNPLASTKGNKEQQQNNRRVEIHMRRPEEPLPPGALPANYEVDCNTRVQTQLKRGVRAPKVGR